MTIACKQWNTQKVFLTQNLSEIIQFTEIKLFIRPIVELLCSISEILHFRNKSGKFYYGGQG
jgi:hypothetical protein